MDFDLSGKLALVTGSTRGIGLAAVKGLAEMGADVIVSGREKGAVDEAIAKLKPIAKGKSHAAAFDLGNADGCARADQAVSRGRHPRQQSRHLRYRGC
jgi:NAD(P)-dependent dehydrogenase (short-subunit alcohol dehydrogenase family)